MIIYKVVNKINGKYYIGKTIQLLLKRKQQHINTAKNKTYNSIFHNAIRKYGGNNFNWKTIKECKSLKEMDNLEIYYINKYYSKKNCYNMVIDGSSGMRGRKHSKKTKIKMSKAHKGKKLKPFTEDHKRKIGEPQKGKLNHMYGKKHTEQHKKKISETMLGNNNHFFGKKHTEETKTKMRKWHKENR